MALFPMSLSLHRRVLVSPGTGTSDGKLKATPHAFLINLRAGGERDLFIALASLDILAGPHQANLL